MKTMDRTTGKDEPPRTVLRLIQTTDVHGHLLPYDYDTDRADRSIGLALAGRIIERLRNEPGIVPLLCDCGDFLQGSVLTAGREDSRSVTIAAMNALRYDAATLGNHEFNYGLDHLRTALDQRNFPLVATNIEGFGDNRLLLTRDTEAGPPVRIGVIGVAPPSISDWDRHLLRDQLRIDPMEDSARRASEALRAEGADVIVALCHSGIREESSHDAEQNVAVQIAALPEVDAVLAGHLHEVFPTPLYPASANIDPARGLVSGTPTTMAGHNASHVGQIDLHLTHDGTAWRVDSADACVHPVRDLPLKTPPLPLDPLVDSAHQQSLELIRTPIGRCDRPLNSYFSIVHPDAAMALVARAQMACAERALDRAGIAPLPLLAAVSPLRSGGPEERMEFVDIPSGAVCRKHLIQLYPYPNSLAVVEMTGAQLRVWLEQVAGLYQMATPGSDTPASIMPAYFFDTLFGLTYTIDLTRPAGQGRIQDLRHDGAPVAPEALFHVATNSFRIGGAPPLTAPRNGRQLEIGDYMVIDALTELFETSDNVTCAPWPTWQFASVPGSGLLFRTSPDALAHVAEAGLTQRLSILTTHPGRHMIMRYALD